MQVWISSSLAHRAAQAHPSHQPYRLGRGLGVLEYRQSHRRKMASPILRVRALAAPTEGDSLVIGWTEAEVLVSTAHSCQVEVIFLSSLAQAVLNFHKFKPNNFKSIVNIRRAHLLLIKVHMKASLHAEGISEPPEPKQPCGEHALTSSHSDPKFLVCKALSDCSFISNSCFHLPGSAWTKQED